MPSSWYKLEEYDIDAPELFRKFRVARNAHYYEKKKKDTIEGDKANLPNYIDDLERLFL